LNIIAHLNLQLSNKRNEMEEDEGFSLEQKSSESLGVHRQLEPLLDVELDGAGVALVQGLKCSAHGVQSHQTADVVVKVHVAVLVAVAADDHLIELIIEREACILEGMGQLLGADLA